jgi:outer membrane lipoprotein LolB
MNASAWRPGWLRHAALTLMALLFAACASPPPATQYVHASDLWQGRLSVQVATEPTQRISADFFLEGSPQAGSLTLDSALGTRMARMQWDATGALLQTPGQTQRFASLDAMVQQTLGSTLPMPALFAWLRGQAVSAAGWELLTLDKVQGRIRARSVQRVPATQLDIVLEAR